MKTQLSDYIDQVFGGNKSEFARRQGVAPQQVTQWLKKNFVVVNGVLYSPRRELVQPADYLRPDLVYLRDLDGTESLHVCHMNDRGAQAYIRVCDFDEDEKDMLRHKNIELCSALKAVLALAGEDDEIHQIIDDVLEECEA